MIEYLFVGKEYPDHNQQQEDIKAFLQKLGDLKEEFESKNGVVIFDYDYPKSSSRHIRYNLESGMVELIAKFNQNQQDQQNKP